MTGPELRREYRAALRRTTPDDLRPLRDAGVGAGLDVGIAVARISVSVSRSSGSLYQPDPDGGDAFIVPVRVANPVTPEAADPADTVRRGSLVDLLAISPAYPRRWALHEFLAELARHHPELAEDINRRLERYAALDPHILQLLGGDRFPPRPLWQAPR